MPLLKAFHPTQPLGPPVLSTLFATVELSDQMNRMASEIWTAAKVTFSQHVDAKRSYHNEATERELLK
jgi:hypothetical protein